jgi:NTE family protein
MSTRTLSEWLAEGPFTLAMSSGFFGFFAHCGALDALESRGLRPAALAGSSAGALVTGLWAAGLDAHAQREALRSLRREDFWDPRPGLGLLRGALFRAKLEALLPVREFKSCRAPLSLSVYDVGARGTRVLTEGNLAPAIHASCALPGLFQPVRHGGRWLLDGGILDRPGLDGVPPGARVLHHHLSSRSPWRRADSPALEPPRREGLVALVLDGLPRSGPFRLEQGALALRAAREAAERALDAPVLDGVVRRQA